MQITLEEGEASTLDAALEAYQKKMYNLSEELADTNMTDSKSELDGELLKIAKLFKKINN